MLYNLKNIFTALCCSTEETETSSALAYALSLAQEAGARLTVQASAQKLSLPHTRVSSTIGGLVARRTSVWRNSPESSRTMPARPLSSAAWRCAPKCPCCRTSNWWSASWPRPVSMT